VVGVNATLSQRLQPLLLCTCAPYHASMSAFPATLPARNDPILNVSQLNRLARSLLEESFPAVLVEGEISNLAIPASGHWYLTLKDDKAQVRCAMFRNRNMFMRCKPRDGMQVLVKGRLSLYEGRGDYQLILDQLEETGDGALRRAFEMLMVRLQQEGLFETSRKRSLPPLPGHIAVITSPTGAAIRDIISVFRRRFPALRLTIVPVTVQGTQSAADLIHALALVNARQGCLHDVDAILLARGGGSLEDLWSFNDEGLARAIAASMLPVVSAVGHESDFTIADFVADLRAATPSAAAELLSPDRQDLLQQLRRFLQQLQQGMAVRFLQETRRLQELRRRLRHPGRRLQEQAQRLDELELRLKRATQARLHTARHRTELLHAGLLRNSPRALLQQHRHQVTALSGRLLAALRMHLQQARMRLQEQSHALHTVSPLATLGRGYAIATTSEGALLTSYGQVGPGATIRTRLAHGHLVSTVEISTPE